MTLGIKNEPNPTYSMHHMCTILGQNRDLYMLMDNGLDMENIVPEKRFGFGFGFPVMRWVGFGPQILPHEGLYPGPHSWPPWPPVPSAPPAPAPATTPQYVRHIGGPSAPRRSAPPPDPRKL